MATTRGMLAPLLGAIALEVDYAAPQRAPWCEKAQAVLAQLPAADAARLTVHSDYLNESHPFEHSRVHYETVAGSAPTAVRFNVSGHNWAYGSLDLSDSCYLPAEEVGCKLASAARVRQQLNLSTDVASSCRDVNAAAIEAAVGLLKTTREGNATLERHARRGRPLCLVDDTSAPFNIGPLFLSEHIKISDNSTCMVVQSLTLGPTGLDSVLFPGVHYCKLLSPARVVDYLMVDSLKPTSGCLNI